MALTSAQLVSAIVAALPAGAYVGFEDELDQDVSEAYVVQLGDVNVDSEQSALTLDASIGSGRELEETIYVDYFLKTHRDTWATQALTARDDILARVNPVSSRLWLVSVSEPERVAAEKDLVLVRTIWLHRFTST